MWKIELCREEYNSMMHMCVFYDVKNSGCQRVGNRNEIAEIYLFVIDIVYTHSALLSGFLSILLSIFTEHGVFLRLYIIDELWMPWTCIPSNVALIRFNQCAFFLWKKLLSPAMAMCSVENLENTSNISFGIQLIDAEIDKTNQHGKKGTNERNKRETIG